MANIKSSFKIKTISDESKAVYTWVIDNYTQSCNSELESPEFEMCGYFWKLVCFPNCKKSLKEDYVCNKVCFKRASPWIHPDLNIYYKYSIQSDREDALITYGSKTYKSYHYFNAYADDRLCIPQSTLNTEFLKNDTLIVLCEIFITKKVIGGCVDTYIREFELLSSSIVGSKRFYFEPEFNDKKYSDVKFNIGGQTLFAHKVILANESGVFASMFEASDETSSSSEIIVADVDYEIFVKFLFYLYTNKIDNLKADAKKMLLLAEKYSIRNLKDICESSLLNDTSVNNAAEMFTLAQLANATKLEGKAVDCIIQKLQNLNKFSFLALSKSKQNVLANIFEEEPEPTISAPESDTDEYEPSISAPESDTDEYEPRISVPEPGTIEYRELLATIRNVSEEICESTRRIWQASAPVKSEGETDKKN